MATAPTAGFWYLIESDSVDNDDWIADHAGDPDLLDLDQYTEYTEYIALQLPKRFAVRGKTGAIVTPSGAGESYDKRKEERFYNTILQGVMGTRTQANGADQFLMSSRHTSGASAVFTRYHLILYFGTNDHIKFTDANGTQQSYCTGIVTDWEIVWLDVRNQVSVLRLNFWSVWEQ